jgi:hypothetical protein
MLIGMLAVATALVAEIPNAEATPHDEPGAGRSFKSPLVTAYKACTSPNATTTGPIHVPACRPPTRMDPICGFGPPGTRGQGKVKGIARNGDIYIGMTASGLEGCANYTLCGVISVRITTEACDDEPCTVIDQVNVSGPDELTACCVVSSTGNCKVKTSANSQSFGLIRPGQRAGIEITSCGLRRTDGPMLPAADEVTFRCGTLSPQ